MTDGRRCVLKHFLRKKANNDGSGEGKLQWEEQP
jgi:hypothetical protein